MSWGFSWAIQNNPLWQEQMLWYRRYLSESPFHARIFFPEDALDPAAQARLCTTLLGEGFDALLVNPLDETAVAQAEFAVRTGDMAVAVGVIRAMDDFLTAGAISSGFLAENHVVTMESLRRERRGRRRYTPYL